MSLVSPTCVRSLPGSVALTLPHMCVRTCTHTHTHTPTHPPPSRLPGPVVGADALGPWAGFGPLCSPCPSPVQTDGHRDVTCAGLKTPAGMSLSHSPDLVRTLGGFLRPFTVRMCLAIDPSCCIMRWQIKWHSYLIIRNGTFCMVPLSTN